MWVLKFIPDMVFYVILFAGLIGIIVSKFIPAYYRSAITAVSILFFCFGLFMSGAIHNNAEWEARVKELEVKLAQAEVESQKENTKIVEKIVYKNQVIKQRGENIIKVIERDVVKYDNQCVIPKEFIDVHNKAAEGVK